MPCYNIRFYLQSLIFIYWTCMHSKIDLPRVCGAYALLESIIVVCNWTTHAMLGKFVGVAVMWQSYVQYARWPAGQLVSLHKLCKVLEQLVMKQDTINITYFKQNYETVCNFWFLVYVRHKIAKNDLWVWHFLHIFASPGLTKSHIKNCKRQFLLIFM